MITASQAKHLHQSTIWFVGEYDSNGQPSKCRVNGKVQLWKTRPNDFKIPVKRGLYDYGYITPSNAARFTLHQPAPRKPKRLLRKTRSY